MHDVFLAHFLVGRLVLQVVVAIGQSQAALQDRDRVVVGVLLVGVDAQIDRTLQAQIGSLEERGDLLVGPGAADLGKPRLRRRQAEPVDAVRIKIGAIEIVKLLPVAAGRSVCRQAIQDFVQLRRRLFAQHRERAPGGPVRRDFRARLPVAVRVAVEIIPGLHALIAAPEIQPEVADLRVPRGLWRGAESARGRATGHHRRTHDDSSPHFPVLRTVNAKRPTRTPARRRSTPVRRAA